MHVILRDKWFSGSEYGRFKPAKRKGDSIEIPDALKDVLPKSAVVVEGPQVADAPAEITPDIEDLADVGQDRAAMDAEAEAMEQAESNRKDNLKRLEAKLVADAAAEDKKLAGYKAAAKKKKAVQEEAEAE